MTTDTSVNVTARWYGGAATYSVYDPEGYLVQQVTFDDASPWEPSIVLEVPVTRQGVYQLQVFNHGGTNTGYDVSWVYDTDIDSNGILDKDEFWFDTNRFSTDQDLDTISDADEWIIGTDWQSSDSDSDALPDNWEILYDLDPLNPNDALDDDDGDTLSNLVEFQYNTNPRLLDTDQDTLPDNWEIENGLNPVMDDSSEDPDNDQISNLDEYLAGTDPNVAEPTPVDYLFTPTILTAGIFVIATVSIFVYRRR
jgi:hypothetical protein